MEKYLVRLSPAPIAGTSSPSRSSPSRLSVAGGMKRKREAGVRSLSQSSLISIPSDSDDDRQAKTNQPTLPRSSGLGEWTPTTGKEPRGPSIEEPGLSVPAHQLPVPHLARCVDPHGAREPPDNQPSPHVPDGPSIEQSSLPANQPGQTPTWPWWADPDSESNRPKNEPSSYGDSPHALSNPGENKLPWWADPDFLSKPPNNEPLPPLPAGDVPVAQEDLDTEPALCKEQQNLVNLIVGKRNVFYTGSAGCGKSTVLKAAVKRLREMGLKVEIVAPTGRAALQVDGRSTWSYMGWTPDCHKLCRKDLISKGFRKHIRQRLRRTDVLIIDEISMVENHHLERINTCMKAVRCYGEESPPAFGGVQVIVTGDFCQLPPVKPFEYCIECGQKMEESTDCETATGGYETVFNCPQSHGPFREQDKWAFKSAAWEEAKFAHIHLKEIHRQRDESFIKMLQKCRLGIRFSQPEMATLMDHPCQVNKATRLLCTRQEVAKVNQENFNRLRTDKYEFKALDGFNWRHEKHPYLRHYNIRRSDGTLEACKDHRLDAHVTLRTAMLVVLQVNLDLRAGLCNGSQGIICGFEKYDPAKLPKARRNGENDHLPPSQLISGERAELRECQIKSFIEAQPLKFWPRVLFHNGTKRTIYATCVINTVGDGEPYSLLHRTQIPLVAGWAMSVHKSQGMTLDRVIVNLSKAFEEGQVYVALSRATSLGGLKIEGGSEGLCVGEGGNDDVRRFLQDKFGDEQLLLDHDRSGDDGPGSPRSPDGLPQLLPAQSQGSSMAVGILDS